ncbi:MAG: three-Cys-motif partner protein TcmP [Polyangiaceae bacterium]
MSDDAYRGREQTLIKHFVLKHYVETAAVITGSSWSAFTYVDGFAGIWRSRKEDGQDSSPVIVLKSLLDVQSILRRRGKELTLKCVFVEKDRKAFARLQQCVAPYRDRVEVLTLNKGLEEAIDSITRFASPGFTLSFIDPTGWTGLGLLKIQPLLRLTGEVLINFMYDHINRFIHSDHGLGWDDLFGGDGWKNTLFVETRAA